MKRRRIQSRVKNQVSRANAGYTLVEMLVAVALVVLMMALFAEVFGLAAGSISTQRGIAENDQAARTLTTVIRADLKNRTFQTVVPFFFQEGSGNFPQPGYPFGERQGFISISENDPLIPTDDVLHLTVFDDAIPYFGKSDPLMPALGAHPNQPEADDGQVTPNGTSSSRVAEVVYFLRNGILYRRVLLVRNPLALDGASRDPETRLTPTSFFDTPGQTFKVSPFSDGPDGQPGVSGTDDDQDGLTDEADEQGWPGSDDGTDLRHDSDDLWRHFDNSAYSTIGVTDTGVKFNGQDLLDDSLDSFPQPPPAALGQPFTRYGHNHETGLVREFDSAGRFFGRFTYEECSHPFFNYPQRFSEDFLTGPGTPLGTNGNPMDPGGMDIQLSQDAIMTYVGGDGALGGGDDIPFSKTHDEWVQQQAALAGTPVAGVNRRAEDILLTNVHAFDIQMWDTDLGQFVDIGYDWNDLGLAGPPNNSDLMGAPPSDSQNQNTAYGNRFDTWHPFANIPAAGAKSPYRIMEHHRNNGHPAFRPAWAPNTPYTNTSRVFPTTPSRNEFYWQCRVISGGTSLANEPSWSAPPNTRDGVTTRIENEDLLGNGDGMFNDGVSAPLLDEMTDGVDYNNDGDMMDMLSEDDPAIGGNGNGQWDRLVWSAHMNWQPLRAIRIRIRFLHVGTGQMRDLTLVHSLL